MFDFLKRKTAKRPNAITVERFVGEGWQTNVENGICDVMIYEPHWGWLKIESISRKNHPIVREAYRLSFSNLHHSIDFYPAIHKTKLQVIYRDPVPFPSETTPKEISNLLGVLIHENP